MSFRLLPPNRVVLPQHHCRRRTDHPAHVWVTASKYCPGRHTPSNHRAPRPSPVVPTDPFAGIAGADEDEEF